MSDSASQSGITFLGLLQILFIGLKLGKVIDWSWWVVFLPTLLDIGVAVFCLMLIAIVVGFKELLKGGVQNED